MARHAREVNEWLTDVAVGPVDRRRLTGSLASSSGWTIQGIVRIGPVKGARAGSAGLETFTV